MTNPTCSACLESCKQPEGVTIYACAKFNNGKTKPAVKKGRK